MKTVFFVYITTHNDQTFHEFVCKMDGAMVNSDTMWTYCGPVQDRLRTSAPTVRSFSGWDYLSRYWRKNPAPLIWLSHRVVHPPTTGPVYLLGQTGAKSPA